MAEEKNKRYRVKVKNSKDNLTLVPFPDLQVKYTNGWNEFLKVKEGEEIPITACDPEDIRKSFLAGSLKRYLDSGWIEEIPPEPKPLSPAIIQAMTPMVGTGDIQDPNVPFPPKQISESKAEEEIKPSLPEAQKTLSNFSLVKNYDDFCKLSYFLKLKFIKESNDIPLLTEIQQKTDSHQFKNNISLRLGK